MKDEQAVGKIVIEKTDKVTGKPIDGVVFEVRDKDGKVEGLILSGKKYESCRENVIKAVIRGVFSGNMA